MLTTAPPPLSTMTGARVRMLEKAHPRPARKVSVASVRVPGRVAGRPTVADGPAADAADGPPGSHRGTPPDPQT